MMKPLLIDTHAHINLKTFKDDGQEVIQRALDSGVWMINVGAQFSTSQRAIEYAEKYQEGVYAAVGLHPSHISDEFDAEKYRELLENPKTKAMGEIGLDYLDETTEEIKDRQKQILLEQIELARQEDKPIIFHCRKAYDDLIEIIEDCNSGCAVCLFACSGAGGKLRGVVHSFMGRLNQAEKLIELGLYLAFNGVITYARDYDKVIKNISLEKILIETDCPYLAPEPHRDKRNEPLYVKLVAEKIAEIKEIEFDQVARQTTQNARDLFGI